MRKILLFMRAVCFLSLLIGVPYPAPVLAASQESFSQLLIDEGKKLIREKNHISASHAFAKALMMNPESEEAKQFLRLLQSGSYSFKNNDPENMLVFETFVERIQRLEHDIQQIKMNAVQMKEQDQQIILALSQEISHLTETLAAKNQDLEGKKEELARLDRKFAALEQLYLANQRSWENERLALITETENLTAALSSIQEKHRSLSNQIALLESENTGLKEEILRTKRASKVLSGLEKAILENMKQVVRKKDQEITQLKEEYAAITRQADSTISMLSQKNNDIAQLESGVRQIHSQFVKAKEHWENQRFLYEQKMTGLNRNLMRSQKTVTSIQESHQRSAERTNNDLARQQIVLTKIKNDLADANHKLAGAQGEIREKDITIRILEENLNILEHELSQFQKGSLALYIKQNDSAKTPNSDLIDHITRNDALIQSLKRDLAEAKQSLAALERTSNNVPQNELLALKHHIAEIQLKLESHPRPNKNN